MLKISENNGTEEIVLVTPTPDEYATADPREEYTRKTASWL